MRYSHQRESIYRAVMESEKHPTAQMVYDALKNDIPKLSLGTVYRNLNQLADAGRLMKIPLADGSCRFDGTNRDHSHVQQKGAGGGQRTVRDRPGGCTVQLAQVHRALAR